MKNVFSFILFVVVVGAHPAYVYRDAITHKLEDTFSDRADHVLNANVPETEVIATFKNDNYGEITLLAGNEPKYGFRHILARHTKKYFVNYNDKNEHSLFSDEVSGTDLIYGIKDFYENCVDIDIYNRREGVNHVFVGFTELDGKRIKCLLAVRQDNMQIVTFYPFNKKTESDLIDDERKRYHYD
ncbi:MAG: hypothetical protein ACPGJS_23105 [Flammeovirgaceae bacterium]